MTDNMAGLVERLRAQAAQVSVPSHVLLLYEAAKALERQPVREGWRPIESAPYDEVCLFLIEGHVVESFIYDGTADDMFGKGKATHWLPLSALPPHPVQGDTDDSTRTR